MEQAVRWQWLTENPAIHASPPSATRREPKPPSADEAQALLQEAARIDPEWAVYLRTAAALGARRGEVCALRWSAIDLEGATVVISRALVLGESGVIDREYPKTSSSRRKVALDPGTAAVLRAHRRHQAERSLACGVGQAADGYVFSAEADGSRPWHPQVVTHRFERLRRRVGLSGVRLHDLRHYVATQLISAGVDLRTVAGRLGHANPNMTLSTYAAWVPARDEAAAAVIGSLLDAVPNRGSSD